MMLAREHGPTGYTDGLPEAGYYEQRPQPPRSLRFRRYAPLAAAALAGGAAAASRALARR